MTLPASIGDFVPQPQVAEDEDLRRRERFPVGASIEFADLEQHGRLDALDRLRDREPVSWVPALGGWLVTAHELGRDVLGHPQDFTVWSDANLVRASLGVMMLTSDAGFHDRQRAPFDEPFRMRPVRARFEQPIRHRVGGLLDGLEQLGGCDLSPAFALPFAIGVAADVLGLSLDDVPKIGGFYEAFAAAMVYDGNPEPQRRADAVRQEFDAILLAELERVRARSDASITSAVANDPHAGLDDQAIAAQLRVILFGAIETVQSMVLNTVLLLLQHPDELAAARGDASAVAGAVDEALRLIPPVAFIERWALDSTSIGGVLVPCGEFVGLSVVAANRDPAVFDEPERFDLRRANARRHLAFSFGVHFCLGFNLARLQGTIAVESLLARLPGLRLVEAPEPFGFAFRKPERLVVGWDT